MPDPHPTCSLCQHYTRLNHCGHYNNETRPTLVCTNCPSFSPAKNRPKTATPAGVCGRCRHWPGASDLLCREGNRHASAKSCKHYALPVNVVPLAKPEKRRRKWSRVLR